MNYCGYCSQHEFPIMRDNYFCVQITSGDYIGQLEVIYDDKIHPERNIVKVVNYCPMCGRKLGTKEFKPS